MLSHSERRLRGVHPIHGEESLDDGTFSRLFRSAGASLLSDVIDAAARRSWLVGTVRMAHICAEAGRLPVKVSEDSGSEALDHRPKTVLLVWGPLDMRRVPT